jgi:hypothetical protein
MLAHKYLHHNRSPPCYNNSDMQRHWLTPVAQPVSLKAQSMKNQYKTVSE